MTAGSISRRTVSDSIAIVDTKEVGGQTFELCATEKASFDEEHSDLIVELGSFVRRVEMRGKDQILHPPWLPKSDSVHVHLEFAEAPDASKDIFKRWCDKIRKAVPPLDQW